MSSATQTAAASTVATGQHGRPGAVTVLVTRRVKAGHELAFERVMADMIDAARAFPGHLGGQLLRPDEDDGNDDPSVFRVVFAFDTAEHLRAWQESSTRSRGLTAVAPHTDGLTQVRQVTGLGYWFSAPNQANQIPPPRWKVAVVTWMGICPTVYVLFVLLGSLLAPWPMLPRVMLLTSLVVIVMTWAVAPQLTQLLKPWLYPVQRPTAG